MNADVRTINQVFAAAKASFRYASDLNVYKEAEHWCAPSELRQQLSANGLVLGDCDDFASLCVYLGRKVGLPMRFVLCLTESGESHLVAEVEGWIMDNRQNQVERRDDLGYTWVAISGLVEGAAWHAIKQE